MNVKKFVIVVVIATIFSASFTAEEYANPSIVGGFRFNNGYTVMYSGEGLQLDIDDGRLDGTYYALAYWSPERIWSMKVGNRSVIWVNIIDWEGVIEPRDRRIEFGEVYKNTLTQQIFDSIKYAKNTVCEAYIKIEIQDNKITKIWTDDDDWRQFAKKIGW